MEEQQRRHIGIPAFGIVLVLLGVLFLLQTTGVVSWRVWVHLLRLWPVLLIIFGLNLWLGPRNQLVASAAVAVALVAVVVTGIALEAVDKPEPSDVSGTLSVQSVFGSAQRAIRGEPFDGGEADAIFGSVDLDLREALHPGGTLTLELNAVFGSVTLRVPREWDVRIDGTPVLGSVNDQRFSSTSPEGAPVLNVDASAVFGSVTIRN